jgi:hypothetical protein
MSDIVKTFGPPREKAIRQLKTLFGGADVAILRPPLAFLHVESVHLRRATRLMQENHTLHLWHKMRQANQPARLRVFCGSIQCQTIQLQ